MKGILLTAGLGTRFRPLTNVVNKTVIPVYNQPMFFYGLKTIINSGIKEIIIIVNPKFASQIKTLVKSYPYKITAKIHFCIQEKPLGMVDAIRSAEKMVDKSNVMVCPGDNIFSDNYMSNIKSFKSGAIAFLRKVKDPERFGTPKYSKDNKLEKILEKPSKPQTKYAVTAPYLFDNNVFKLIKFLKPSQRGELEITDLLNIYLESNSLSLCKRKEIWYDTGTFQSLLSTSIFVSKNQRKFFSS